MSIARLFIELCIVSNVRLVCQSLVYLLSCVVFSTLGLYDNRSSIY